MAEASVLIVGAGPTGLVLAIWLTRQGVPVRVIDRAAEPGTTSRALAVHARTLELYQQADLADVIVQKGYAVPGARLWAGGRQVARVPFEELVSELTPYGFLHIFPQDEHERLLVDRLAALGVRVERPSELLDFVGEGDRIKARIRGAGGREEIVETAFIAGCDGARSTVRERMGSGFPGGAYKELFYVADVSGEGAGFNGDLNVELDSTDFLAIFPMAHAGRVRLIGAVKPRDDQQRRQLTFEDISDFALRTLRLKVDRVTWFSTYHVHHRVTDRFRSGRAFLLGDAAHIHTPVGGQGMNTGIGDAINLAWKLAAVLSGRAPDALLDSYEAERRAFALRLVATTDRLFTIVAAESAVAGFIRSRIVPLVMPQVMKLGAVRDYLFRTVSQVMLNYRDKGLDQGRAGPVHGGDRLPWVKLDDGDNYRPLRRMAWQAHVYGRATDELQAWCEKTNVLLEVAPWSPRMRRAGLRENAVYLLRPDTYVAAVEPTQATGPLDDYLKRVQIRP